MVIDFTQCLIKNKPGGKKRTKYSEFPEDGERFRWILERLFCIALLLGCQGENDILGTPSDISSSSDNIQNLDFMRNLSEGLFSPTLHPRTFLVLGSISFGASVYLTGFLVGETPARRQPLPPPSFHPPSFSLSTTFLPFLQ